MRINDDLSDLTISALMIEDLDVLHAALIHDSVQGPVLVDAGIPGLLSAFQDAVSTAGESFSAIKTILITHHDYDHIGALPAIFDATHAQVLASPKERPYIQDGLRAQKPPAPERVEMALKTLPEGQPREYFRAMWTHVQPPVPVARTLQDGELLDFAGGVRVVYTPGHTVGHISFFLERSRVLIAGDALMAMNGRLTAPWDRATPDMQSAAASVRRLTELEPSAILCYHGGLVSEDAARQLRRVSESM